MLSDNCKTVVDNVAIAQQRSGARLSRAQNVRELKALHAYILQTATILETAIELEVEDIASRN